MTLYIGAQLREMMEKYPARRFKVVITCDSNRLAVKEGLEKEDISVEEIGDNEFGILTGIIRKDQLSILEKIQDIMSVEFDDEVMMFDENKSTLNGAGLQEEE